MKNLLHHTSVWFELVRLSLKTSLIYKAEAFARLGRVIFVVFVQLITLQAMFQHKESISGLDINDFYLILGVFNIVNYLGWGVFTVNLWRLEKRVLQREFDNILLYPVNSLFYSSFYNIYIEDIVSAASGLIMILVYISRSSTEITLVSFIAFTLATISAIVIWYSINVIAVSFTFTSVKASLGDVAKSFSRVGTFPPQLFSENVKLIFFSVFPIFLISAVPGSLLIGGYGVGLLVYSYAVMLLFLLVSILIWNRSIRKYLIS